MNDPIHVAYCFDRHYRQHFGAAVTSLALNAGADTERLHVHLVTDAVDDTLNRQIDQLRHTFRAQFTQYSPSAQQLTEMAALPHWLPTLPHVSSFAYARLLLPHLLPQSIERVLYLDADTIVRRSLAELFETPLGGRSTAAAPDPYDEDLRKQTGLPRYFNSGVLLMDLARWRAQDIGRRCLIFAHEQRSRLIFGDQCALNHVLRDDIEPLHSKWNHAVQPGDPRSGDGSGDIVHFVGSTKPWQAWYEHPAGELYWRYLNVSPWSGAQAETPVTVEQAFRLARLERDRGRFTKAMEMYDLALVTLSGAKGRS